MKLFLGVFCKTYQLNSLAKCLLNGSKKNGSMQFVPIVPAFLCCAEMLLLLALFGLSSSPENYDSFQDYLLI